MFNRNVDPNNLEELMIAEYTGLKDELKEEKAAHELTKQQADAQYTEIMELLEEAEEKNRTLTSIIMKDEGVVDLHAPILLYKSDIASDYYFKDWLNDHATDEGDDSGIDAYINAINSNDEDCIKWFEEHSKSYHKMVERRKHIFKFTLQVPLLGIFAYDPEYNKTSLFVPNTTYADNSWVDMPLETFNKNVAKKVREIANRALKEYTAEQEAKDTDE